MMYLLMKLGRENLGGASASKANAVSAAPALIIISSFLYHLQFSLNSSLLFHPDSLPFWDFGQKEGFLRFETLQSFDQNDV